MNNEIDFVIPWVDGSDKDWISEKNKYDRSNINIDNGEDRYRDWDLLKYWFRGVEKFAPWVHKIYFITWGHLPNWLNVNNEKIVIVNHKDYIPEKYLPTFNSHTIELNINKIKGLSENFVYFNDDIFIINPTSSKDFFQNGLPCDASIFTPNFPRSYDDLAIICANMIGIINSNFSKKECVKKNWNKYINIKYGLKNFRTIYSLILPNFIGFYNDHLPRAYKKSILDEVWNKEYDVLNNTCLDKFRNKKTNVNQWLFRYWQFAKGTFKPRSLNLGKSFGLGYEYQEAINYLKYSNGKLICLNDTDNIENFEQKKVELINVFEKKFPSKSSFER